MILIHTFWGEEDHSEVNLPNITILLIPNYEKNTPSCLRGMFPNPFRRPTLAAIERTRSQWVFCLVNLWLPVLLYLGWEPKTHLHFTHVKNVTKRILHCQVLNLHLPHFYVENYKNGLPMVYQQGSESRSHTSHLDFAHMENVRD